jgi:colanic acid biosynthesis glycosyl transferase WcaI
LALAPAKTDDNLELQGLVATSLALAATVASTDEKSARMRVQLWSYNYDPEPTGIAPVSTTWARAMRDRGHQVSVVAAHPHYPRPEWGTRLRPYRENRDGIPVMRLPLWIGRSGGLQRVRQEVSYMLSQTAAVPALGDPEVVVAVSPSFPALMPAMLGSRIRRRPWVLWLQDILPDGAAATGLLPEGPLLGAARAFERAAYRSADRIVVISGSFEENLLAKGVPAAKLARIYNFATRPVAERPPADRMANPVVLHMGNIGFSQGLAPIVDAFARSAALESRNVTFEVTGDGLAADDLRSRIRSPRVRLRGVLPSDELEQTLQRATFGLVSQHFNGVEFNVPSKLMNFMGYGIPIIAAVRPESEVARIVESAGAGWIADPADDEAFARVLAAALDDPAEAARRGEAGLRFARERFTPERSAEHFERLLEATVSAYRGPAPRRALTA